MGEGVLTRPTVQPSMPGRTGFHRRGGTLHCDGVALPALAEAAGTPAFVYSASTIREQYARLTSALAGLPHRLHYSVKANSNLAVLSLLRAQGAGVDIVSGGELFRALRAGFQGADVVFSGVAKTERELEDALRANVRLFNVESETELHRLDGVAARLGERAPVALRVNPEVTVDTPHPYTRTGEKGMKFGIPYDQALALGRTALGLGAIDLVGLDMHIGSQIAEVGPYVLGLRRLLELMDRLRDAGASGLRVLDIGGGLAVRYDGEAEPDLEAFAAAVHELVAPTGLALIVEPGRFLVANAGVLLTRVIDRKHSGGKEYVLTDAGMNDLLRPSHYHAIHRIESVVLREPRARIVADVVGPVCESGDFLALDREIDDVAAGELLVVHSTGAYGFVMSSNYNSRPRAAELLVDGDRFAVIREREDHEDLVRHESASPAWRSS